MLLLSSLHIHEQGQLQADNCTECVERHCGGHLTQLTVHQHDCVLCQFVSLPFLLATTAALAIFTPATKADADLRAPFCPVATVGRHASRAPPRSF